jgi:hypothetical protein
MAKQKPIGKRNITGTKITEDSPNWNAATMGNKKGQGVDLGKRRMGGKTKKK